MVAVGQLLNGVLSMLALGAVVLPGAWYALRWDELRGVTTTEAGLSWGDVDAESTEVLVTLQFETQRASADLLAVRLEAMVDERVVATEDEGASLFIGKDGLGMHQSAVTIPTPDLLRALFASAAAGRETRFEVAGEGVFSVANGRRAAPFHIEAAWSLPTVSQVPPAASCDKVTAGPCLAAVRGRWASDGYLAFVLDLTVHNPTERSLSVGGASGSLALGNVSVAGGDAAEPLVLGPGKDGVMRLVLPVQAEQMFAWWPQHVGRCERSDVHVVVRAEHDGGHVEWTLPAPRLDTQVVCGPNAWFGDFEN